LAADLAAKAHRAVAPTTRCIKLPSFFPPEAQLRPTRVQQDERQGKGILHDAL
jgi:hypothetical protein